jgi:hypothetical protein
MRPIILVPGDLIAAAYFDYQIHLILNHAQASAGLMPGLPWPLADRARPGFTLAIALWAL